MKFRLAFILLFCGAAVAFAQSNPGLLNGQMPPAAQWNNLFAGKQDYISSVVPGYVWAGPCGGSTTSAPTFRPLCSSDIPGTLAQTSAPNIWAQPQTFQGSITVPVRVITSGSTVTVSATTDHTICVNKTSGSATTVNLPPNPPTGLVIEVDDCKGDANTNNITVFPAAGLIDGAASFIINSQWGVRTFTNMGTFWKAS